MEAAHRASLAKGEVGIREKKPIVTLKDFLTKEFLPFAETNHANKPLTLRYYKQGSDMLAKSRLAAMKLNELTNQQAQDFARQYAALSPSGINRGLRTLRRALNLAHEWGKTDKLIKIKLASGEHRRDQVLNDEEIDKYLNACPQPRKDCATLIVDEGFRPEEVFALRWAHLLFNENGTGLIEIVEGKSKAARRGLPMTPRVFQVLRAKYDATGRPEDGWVFPCLSTGWTFKGKRAAKCQHFNGDTAKEQHKKALTDSGVKSFVPYTLRHTALTLLGERAGAHVFALAKIAGHSSITITQRYVHPQAQAIDRVFAAPVPRVGTKPGTVVKRQKKTARTRRLILLEHIGTYQVARPKHTTIG